MRFTMCVPKRPQPQVGVSRACFLRFPRVRIISISPSTARDRRSSDTDAGIGPFFSSSRKSSLPGRCPQTPARPQDPFTGTAVLSRQKKFFGFRPFRTLGSSRGVIVSRFGKLGMLLLLSWRRFLAARSQRSFSERIFVDIPRWQLVVPSSCLHLHLLGP